MIGVGTVGTVVTLPSIYMKYLSISWAEPGPHRIGEVGTGGYRRNHADRRGQLSAYGAGWPTGRPVSRWNRLSSRHDFTTARPHPARKCGPLAPRRAERLGANRVRGSRGPGAPAARSEMRRPAGREPGGPCRSTRASDPQPLAARCSRSRRKMRKGLVAMTSWLLEAST